MRVAALALMLAASPALALEVPSGQPVTLQEVLVDSVGPQSFLRFRLVAPAIARETSDLDYETVAADLMYLCQDLAIPYIAEFELTGDVIVISLADRETEFGVADPESTQFFEAFRIEEGRCIWEGL
ncbi:hypothetical protein BOO69_05130 [Sulfitobacter alexandrii]|uniref:Acetolactate synthase n=1 Tax=Sulfitobacter alexandrii TaxID=1917485 RepID=A0A1J0WEZ3_9RHOB|nr:DUF6497 family protein [Sulfitobacter alexandrii]APE42875.1 hypothetical protein BOO69_05130 [Sulfitobacter alexandrii]